MTQSNVNPAQDPQSLGEPQLSVQNIEQALDILSAEAGNLSDVQYQETALANVNLLRDLMRQTGVVTPMMANPGGPVGAGPVGAIGDVADRAIGVAKQVQNLGFVDFTAGLINGTFDAIIGATIKQMDAYAKLVADLAKTLAQFQAENVSDAQVNAHLSNRYPDGEGSTSVRLGFVFKDTAADAAKGVTGKTASENMQAVVVALILETVGLKEADRLTRVKLGIAETDTPTSFTAEQIALIRTTIGMTLASDMLEQLRAMAREGMARIVITDGSIRTKLTFKVDSTEVQTKQKEQYKRDSVGAYVRGSAGWGWGKVSAGVSYSNVNVNTVNETSFDSLTMSTEMIGEVVLKFKTETFAPVVTQGA